VNTDAVGSADGWGSRLEFMGDTCVPRVTPCLAWARLRLTLGFVVAVPSARGV